MSGGVDDFRDSFFEECEELLEAMHDGFELIASETNDSETIHAVFRAVHSIKGGAGAFGLDDLVAFAHHFETALEKVRSGEIDVEYDVLELFKRCGDHLADLVAVARDGSEADLDTSAALGEKLNEVIGHDPNQAEDPEPDFEPQAINLDLMDMTDEPRIDGFSISFEVKDEIWTSGDDPVLIFKSLEKLGIIEVIANLSRVECLTDLARKSCAISWTIYLKTEVAKDKVLETFEFVDDCCDLKIEEWSCDGLAGAPTEELKPDESDITPSELELPLPETTSELVSDRKPDDIVGEAKKRRQEETQASGVKNKASEKPKGGSTIRVDLERVDKLINLVGELVIKEAMLSQTINSLKLPSENQVSVALESLKQLAGEIQEGVMAIRAQPVKPMFQRMARIARESATATGKRVKFETRGEYTEVDKTVIERLVDPLTHMIRNAVDHGLEDTETRLANGKSEEGNVVLSAAHRSGRVVIDISDDGGGINRPRVLEIAQSKGLVPEDAELAPNEIDNLLFMPGFSSKDEVSELSGRGVGLDVARSEIQALGGRVTIQSTAGEGTTFAISLPLTLAVMEGMVIDVSGQTMVVPITAIQETLQPRTVPIHRIGAKGRVLRNRDSLVPIVDLGQAFQFRMEPDVLDDHVLLLIETENDRRCALVVDHIQDQRQVVIKSLETNYRRVEGVAAATILGDGRIALIIDPDSIVRGASFPIEQPMQLIG